MNDSPVEDSWRGSVSLHTCFFHIPVSHGIVALFLRNGYEPRRKSGTGCSRSWQGPHVHQVKLMRDISWHPNQQISFEEEAEQQLPFPSGSMSGAQDARILFGRVEVEAGRLGCLDELRQQRDDESDDEARSVFFWRSEKSHTALGATLSLFSLLMIKRGINFGTSFGSQIENINNISGWGSQHLCLWHECLGPWALREKSCRVWTY